MSGQLTAARPRRMVDPRYPLLVTIDCPARDGRPARTFQQRVTVPLTDAERDQWERLADPVVDALLAGHPNWTREMAHLAVVTMLLEHFDDLDTYERVSIEKGLLPL